MNENEQGWKRYYNPETNKKATTRYRKNNLTRFNLVFHNEHDWDIMCRLDAEGKQNKAKYIKNLIREDMRRTGFQAPPSPAEIEAQGREAERLAEVEKWHQTQAEAAEVNRSERKPVQSGDAEAEARKLLGM